MPVVAGGFRDVEDFAAGIDLAGVWVTAAQEDCGGNAMGGGGGGIIERFALV